MYPQPLSDQEKAWLALYPSGVGPRLAPKHADALALFLSAVKARPDHVAIRFFERAISYRELDQAADALAAYFQNTGIAPGARVVIALQNSPEFVVALLAAWKAGAAPLPVNPMYRRHELAKIFTDAEPSLIVCEPADADEMAAGASSLARCPLLLAEPIGLAFHFGERRTPENLNGAPRLTDVLKQHAGARPTAPHLQGDTLGLLMYTSGTTGVPKGAMLRHDSLATNGELLAHWCGINAESRIWAVAPFFHITGLICHILTAFSAAATVVMHYRFHPELAVNIIRQTRPTFSIGAITAFNALMNVPGVVASDFTSFDRLYSGGAPIPPALVDAFEQKLGVRIYPSYGMTETAAPTHLSPFRQTAPVDPSSGALSIGVPAPNTDAAVVDDEDRPLGPNEVGEIVMRGPQIMTGYWRKRDESAIALKNGWMHSGDVGFRDEAGWFYLVDRKKDMIIASGFKVWPREVEDVLYMHPGIREAAVIGVPDAYRGETVKAYVSLVSGASVSIAELEAHCRDRLASYKAPRLFEIMAELPKTATGKIQRVALRA